MFTATVRVVAAIGVLAGVARAEDAFFRVSASTLKLIDGRWPQSDPTHRGAWEMVEVLRPYAALDAPGEVFVTTDSEEVGRWGPSWSVESGVVVVRAAAGAEVTGTIYVPDAEWERLVPLRFSIPADAAAVGHRHAFYSAKAAAYERLQSGDFPGTAWFRRQADLARREIGEKPDERWMPRAGQELDDTYSLFSGGRALSENLQLARDVTQGGAEPDTGQDLVPVDSIEGITVREIDWSTRLTDPNQPPALDSLASLIPADQHAVFFPSFDALARLADEADDEGLPLFRSVAPRSEDAGVMARYERQLCLSTRGLARVLGPLAVRSVALTGSDPYYPTGTDVAVILETANPEALAKVLVAQVKAATASMPAVKTGVGDADGLKYEWAQSDDRVVSSLIATLPKAVVVANSRVQIVRLAAAATGKAPALGSLKEYWFFRTRYPASGTNADDGKGETAFVFLSDATIRRWCGPRWRMGASRRLRAAALMADVTAANMDQLVAGVASSREVHADAPMRTIGTLTLGPDGVSSSVYGSMRFITPIAELDLAQVTKDEATAYGRWRDGYQRNWSWAFDPIGIRLRLADDRAEADMTIMPLIVGSRYRQWIGIAQGAEIRPGAADPHDAIAHGVFAINIESAAAQQMTGFARMVAPQIEVDPLGWLGQSVAIYADPDPFWQELAAATEPDKFFEENAWRTPVALYAEVGSALKLTAFLTALRGFVDQSAPGMSAWETRTHSGQPYVRVGMSEQAQGGGDGDPFDRLAVYYAAMPRALIVSISEDVLKRAIDRELARRKAGDGAAPAQGSPPWLGTSMALRASAPGLEVLQKSFGAADRAAARRKAWSNLPILTEWKRRYPDHDPVEVHQRFWGTRLVCPAGGTYEWRSSHRSMASTATGHPGEPVEPFPAVLVMPRMQGADFGLTFEPDGLRARARIDRAAK